MKQMISLTLKKIVAWRHIDVTVLLASLGVYVALVLSTISHWSIWFDEAFSAYIVRFNFYDIAHYTALDVHPPLYYWVVKLWTMGFGTSELGFRSLSLVFGVTAIIFGFLLVKKLFGRRAAWISLLFLVLSPMLIRYGQEARAYTMVAAIAMAATYTLTVAMESKRRLPWIIYGLLVAAGMWTHYFIAVVWIAHWIWRGIVIRHQKYRGASYFKKFFSKQWIGAHALAVLLFLPWIKPMADQLFGIQVGWFWINPVGADTLTNYVTTILFYREHGEVTPWMALLFIVVTSVLAIFTGAAYRRSNAVQRKNYLLIACIAVVPVLLVFIASLPPLRSSFIERYMMPSVVGFSLFAGVIIAAVSPRLKPASQLVVIALVAGSMVIGIVHVQTVGNFNKVSGVSSDTKGVVAGIAARAASNEPIIARSPWLFYEAVFYETSQHPLYYLKSTVAREGSGSLAMLQGNDSHNIVDLDSFAAQHPIVWYFGEPGDKDLPAPAAGWTALQSFKLYDPVTGKLRYQAVQFQTQP